MSFDYRCSATSKDKPNYDIQHTHNQNIEKRNTRGEITQF